MSIRRSLLLGALVWSGVGTAAVARAGQLDLPPRLAVAASIPAAELLDDARRLLPAGGFIGPLLDAKYAVIDHAWLEGEFLRFYRGAATDLRAIAAKDDEAADCDNYGMFLRHLVGLAGMMGRTDEPAAAQMIVVQNRAFSGVPRTRENHSVGLFRTDRGWYVLEPQNGGKLVPFERYANRTTVRYITFH